MAAEVAADPKVETEISQIAIYAVICLSSVFFKRYTLNQGLIMTEEIICNVRLRLVDKIRRTELRFLEGAEKEEIYSKIINETQVIAESLPFIVGTFDVAVTSVMVLIYIALLSVNGFLITLISVSIMYLIFFSGYAVVKDKLISARKKEGDFLTAISDTIFGFKEIKINTNKNDALFADIEKLAEESAKLKTGAEISYDKSIVLYISLYLMVLAVITYILPGYSHNISPDIVKIVSMVLFLLGLLTMVVRSAYFLIKSDVAAENLEKLETDIEAFAVDKKVSPAYIPDRFDTIELDSVTFEYTDKEGQNLFTLGPINLNIRRGDVLFIVGGNGSGKSTLLKLLTGLYYPMKTDCIKLNGQILVKQTYPMFRELFSVIFTDFHLFRKLYGLESVDENEIRELIKQMDIDKKTDYIDGEFTNIDLSTGQRKRVAYIAALLDDKPIYIFDEWAADQDPTFRRYFYEKFLDDLKMMNKTVIAVTHDDMFFDKADQVIKLEEGRIVKI